MIELARENGKANKKDDLSQMDLDLDTNEI
jgi:hypothetical protein